MIIVIICIILGLMRTYNNLNREAPKTDNMTWLDFEKLCVDILQKNKFQIIHHYKKEEKHGVDILCEKNGKTYAIQCKSYSSMVRQDSVFEVERGKKYFNADVGVLMTNNFFCKNTIVAACSRNIVLWNRNKLIKLYRSANKENAKKKTIQTKKRKGKRIMYGLSGKAYPQGQYTVGEDFPLGKYLFVPYNEYSGNVKIFNSYDEYITGKEGRYESFGGKEYFINFKNKGNYIIVENALFKSIS